MCFSGCSVRNSAAVLTKRESAMKKLLFLICMLTVFAASESLASRTTDVESSFTSLASVELREDLDACPTGWQELSAKPTSVALSFQAIVVCPKGNHYVQKMCWRGHYAETRTECVKD